MPRIVCHTGLLTAADVTSMDALWSGGTFVIDAPVLTSIAHVVEKLRTDERVSFRFEDFERQRILWRRVGPAAAIVQERRDGQLHCIHLLSRGPTGEVWWEKRVAPAVGEEGSLLGVLVLVPAFAEWSEAASNNPLGRTGC